MSKTARYRMVGNGVAVPHAEWVARRARTGIEKTLAKQKEVNDGNQHHELEDETT